MNRTLTIIKPDAFGSGKAGLILAHLEKAGFKVIASRVMHLTDAQAKEFYAVHRDRPFYGSLVSFMTRLALAVQTSLWAAHRMNRIYRMRFVLAQAGSCDAFPSFN